MVASTVGRILLVAVLAAAVLTTSTPAGASSLTVATEAEYRAALDTLSDASGPHTVILTADLMLDDGTDPVYSGSEDLTIDGDGHTIDATGTSRILEATVVGTQAVTIVDATLTGGYTTGAGGAVRSGGQVVHLVTSTVHGNRAAYGGALAASHAGGAAIGVVTVTNSTLTDNVATVAGGGLHAGGIALVAATLAGNDAPSAANLSTTGNLDPTASVLAEPTGGVANCTVGGATNSGGYNHATDSSCGLTGTGDTQSGADPQLGALADNGGPTPTRRPAVTSPLVDAYPRTACSGVVDTDQRGIARPQPFTGECDIGAVEFTAPAVLPVTDEATFRNALAEASWDTADPHTVLFAADVTLDDSTDPTYTGREPLTVDGAGHVLDAGHTSRGLAVAPSSSRADLHVSDLTVRNGTTTGDGGGIATSMGLTLAGVNLVGNHADGDGGGASTAGSDHLVVTGGSFDGNTAGGSGGALDAARSVTVTGATFTDNEAGSRGGAIVSATGGTTIGTSVFTDNAAGGDGGAVAAHSTVALTSSTVNENDAGGDGGGVETTGAAVVATDSEARSNTAGGAGGALYASYLTVTRSTLASNRADEEGGALHAGTAATVTNSTITGNHAARGGGISSRHDVGLTHATVAGNSATSPAVGANVDAGGMTTTASVLAQPIGSGVTNCAATTTSGGHNWADDTSCGLTGTGDVEAPGASPMLGGLWDNGGPTLTHYPALASPLVNAIPKPACSTTEVTDQRGTPRPFPAGGNCDIGAVERTPLAGEARPDGRIRGRVGPTRGNDIYNRLTPQTVTRVVPARTTATFVATVENDAWFPDVLLVRGQRSTNRFTVRYTGPSGTNVTRSVVNGTRRTPVLAPRATYRLTIRVTVRSSAPRGARLTRTLTATSATHAGRTDTVRFITSRR